MPSVDGLIAHWYFHIPSLILMALAVLLMVRFLWELAAGAGSRTFVHRLLAALTAPAVVPVRVLTPAIVPARIVVLLAVLWVMAARIVWYLACTAAGMRLSLGA